MGADYGSKPLTEAEAQHEDAQKFLDRTREFLTAQGFTDRELDAPPTSLRIGENGTLDTPGPTDGEATGDEDNEDPARSLHGPSSVGRQPANHSSWSAVRGSTRTARRAGR